MKVSDYIADQLAVRQVPAVFELVGGMITHLLDAVHRRGVTPVVSMRHEQAAAFAAEGCGRMSAVPAVAMATSGPGATNLLTGIASCFFDSVPAVFITGQVNRSEQKGASGVRQLGFQETDILSMARPVTKAVWQARDKDEIPDLLEQAFAVAVSGRPGPTLLDIPMDIQREEIDPRVIQSATRARQAISVAAAEQIRNALLQASRPIILAGGGIRAGRAVEPFRRLIQAAQIPVVNSLMGVDLLPFTEPLHIGMIGSYGNRWANLALHRADCLIVLGSRLDIRQTGADTRGFKGERPIFHIDCDVAEMNNRIPGCVALEADLSPSLEVLAGVLEPVSSELRSRNRNWLDEIYQMRVQWPDTGELKMAEGLNPNVLMHELARHTKHAAAYVTDVGQHQMWAAQSLELNESQRFLTSGGMGSMGFGLPASIGAAIASGGRPVVLIAGDGGFQCNIQELSTIAHLKLPIKCVILNNQCHGMVRQFQESYFESRYQSTMWGYSAPNFTAIAEAYGIPARSAVSESAAFDGIRWLAEDTPGPALLELMISPYTNTYPKLAFGRGMEAMEPFAQPLDMEGT